jgi:hypothetical protein
MTLKLSNTAVALITTFALAGLVISWAFFIQWGRVNGLDFVGFWTHALTSEVAATGLSWDLTASALIVTVLTITQRDRLGTPRLIGVLLCTWTLGVCVGLGALVLSRSRLG